VATVTNGTSFVVNNAVFYTGGGLSLDATTVNHAYALKHYDLFPGELTSGLRMRFQLSGYAPVTPARTPICDIDDVLVMLTTGNAPVVLTMADDGAHGDGAAGDGVFGAVI